MVCGPKQVDGGTEWTWNAVGWTRSLRRRRPLEAWLEANGADADEVLVRMAGKRAGLASLDWAGTVDVALCFAVVDGRSKRVEKRRLVRAALHAAAPADRWMKVNRRRRSRR